MKLNILPNISPRFFTINEEVSPSVKKELLQMLMLALVTQKSYATSLKIWKQIRDAVGFAIDPSNITKQIDKTRKLKDMLSKVPEGQVKLGIFYGRPAKIQFIPADEFVGYLEKMASRGAITWDKFEEYVKKIKGGEGVLKGQPTWTQKGGESAVATGEDIEKYERLLLGADLDLYSIYQDCLLEVAGGKAYAGGPVDPGMPATRPGAGTSKQTTISDVLRLLDVPNQEDWEHRLEREEFDIKAPINMPALSRIAGEIDDAGTTKVAEKINNIINMDPSSEIDQIKAALNDFGLETRKSVWDLVRNAWRTAREIYSQNDVKKSEAPKPTVPQSPAPAPQTSRSPAMAGAP